MYVYIHTHVCVCTHVNVYIYVYMCMHVCACVCIQLISLVQRTLISNPFHSHNFQQTDRHTNLPCSANAQSQGIRCPAKYPKALE